MCSSVLLFVSIILCLVMLVLSFGGVCLSVIFIDDMIWFSGLVSVLRILLLEIVKLCGMFFDRLWFFIFIFLILEFGNVELIFFLIVLVVCLLISIL